MQVDDFERSDGPPGPNWSWQAGIGAPLIRGGTLGSLDNRLVITWWNTTQFASNQFSEAVIAAGFDTTATFAVQVFVRRQGSGTPWRYGFHFQPPTGEYQLKYDGGSPGIVLATRPGVQFKPGDVVRIEARGNVLTGYLNGAVILTVTHNALTDGRPGVVINGVGKVGPTRNGVEVWRGGDLGP